MEAIAYLCMRNTEQPSGDSNEGTECECEYEVPKAFTRGISIKAAGAESLAPHPPIINS